jgi:hypothetical protein
MSPEEMWLRDATSEPNFVKFLQSVHQTLGAVRASAPKGTIFELAQGTIRLNYDTTFARGTGLEQFEWKIEDSRAILYGYRINSKELGSK